MRSCIPSRSRKMEKNKNKGGAIRMDRPIFEIPFNNTG